jgi:hypothetical protein
MPVPTHMPPSPEDALALPGRTCAVLLMRGPQVFTRPTRWHDGSKELSVGVAFSPSKREDNIFVVASEDRFPLGAMSRTDAQRFPNLSSLGSESSGKEKRYCALRQPTVFAETGDRRRVYDHDRSMIRESAQRSRISRPSFYECRACEQCKKLH